MFLALVVSLTFAFSGVASDDEAPDERVSEKRHDVPAQTSRNTQRIEQVDALVRKQDYEEARELVLIVLATKDLTPEQLFHVQMQAGIVQRIVDRDVEARMHFTEALLVRPDAVLPDSVSPKIRTFFEMVKRDVERDVERNVKRDVERNVKRDVERNVKRDVERSANSAQPRLGENPSETALPATADNVSLPILVWANGAAALTFAILAPAALGLSIASYTIVVTDPKLSVPDREVGRIVWFGAMAASAISAFAAVSFGAIATLVWIGEAE